MNMFALSNSDMDSITRRNREDIAWTVLILSQSISKFPRKTNIYTKIFSVSLIVHCFSASTFVLAKPVYAEELVTNYIQADREQILLGCWERNKSAEQSKANRKAGDLPFAALCLSADGELRGFFVGSNGLGGDMKSSWQILGTEAIEIDGARCTYVVGPDRMKLTGCYQYAGNWTKRCAGSRMNSDHNNCR